MQPLNLASALFCLLLLLVLSGASRAAVYRYVDDRGVIHFTNKPDDPRWTFVPTSPTAVVSRQKERERLSPPAQDVYDNLIFRAARSHRVQPALVKAVIAAESNFESRAVSRVGAQGLMQLMPQTARELGVANPFHPVQNVDGGTRYLRQMLDRYGDLRRALAAYNAGPTAVDHYKGIPPYSETQDYVVRVLNYYQDYYDEFRRRARQRADDRDREIERLRGPGAAKRREARDVRGTRGLNREGGARR